MFAPEFNPDVIITSGMGSAGLAREVILNIPPQQKDYVPVVPQSILKRNAHRESKHPI